ncbi:hypothetical protein PMAYCL1PPCAC_30888, partial [Pristionchus mayeri]
QRVDTRDNLPPSRVRSVGAWTEQFSSNGRRYFYNRDTEVSQWDKPTVWIDAEAIVDGGDVNDDDRDERFSLGRDSDQGGSSPEKIDVSDDENSPMEEDVDEEEMKRRTIEAEAEKMELERKKEESKLYDYKNYLMNMDEEDMQKMYKHMFGVERVVRAEYSKDQFPLHLSRRVDDLKFQIELDVKMLEVSRARRKAEASEYEASFLERKAEGLYGLQKELDKRRLNFEANFDMLMPKLVAQAKIPTNGEDTSESDGENEDIQTRIEKRRAKKARRQWMNWGGLEKIVENHQALLALRSDDYHSKRAEFLDKYRPKEPTPSPEPTAVVLDDRKLRDLEVRSPSPSYVDDNEIEMVVSPVYDDEYDPTARSPRYSSRSSSCRPRSRSSATCSSPEQSSLLLGTEPFRTQEYARPQEYILDAPPPMPILNVAAIEAADRKKRRSGRDTPCSSGSPVSPSHYHSPRNNGSPMVTDVKSPAYSPLPKGTPPVHHPHHPISPQEQAPQTPQCQSQVLSFQSPPMILPMQHPPPPFNALDIPGFDPTRPPPAIFPQRVMPQDTVILPPPPAPPILDKIYSMNSPF